MTRPPSLQAGFTLIELLTVAAIIVIITSMTLVNDGQFGGAIQLDNLAYDLSLSIRQAQVYGISVARIGTNTYSAGYGVHFDLADPTEYEFFGDVNGNGLYDTSGTTPAELVQINKFPTGYVIGDLCYKLGGVETCLSAGSAPKTVDILFKRPEPDAWIAAQGGAGFACNVAPNRCMDSVRAILRAPRGNQISVIIYNNGQISVQGCHQQVYPTFCTYP